MSEEPLESDFDKEDSQEKEKMNEETIESTENIEEISQEKEKMDEEAIESTENVEEDQNDDKLKEDYKAKDIFQELSEKSEIKKEEKKKREFKDIIGLEQFVEGILYILARPVSLKEVMLFTQINQEKVEELIEIINNRYQTDNTPYCIFITDSEDPDLKMFELRLSEKAFGILSNVDFVTTQELPAKYYKFMSTVTFLEFVENQKITLSSLVKILGIEKSVVEKNIRVLVQYGFLDIEMDKETFYTTSPRFLRKMGLPTDVVLAKKVLKDKAISFAMKQSGFDEI